MSTPWCDHVDAAVKQIPFYRDERVVSPKELWASIAENLRFLISAIDRPASEPLDTTAPGRSLADPHQVAELAAAAYAVRMDSEDVREGG